MYIRVLLIKFPNENRKKLVLAFINSMQQKFDQKSKIIDFQILDIGEGKILNIARYHNKKDFEEMLLELSKLNA